MNTANESTSKVSAEMRNEAEYNYIGKWGFVGAKLSAWADRLDAAVKQQQAKDAASDAMCAAYDQLQAIRDKQQAEIERLREACRVMLEAFEYDGTPLVGKVFFARNGIQAAIAGGDA